MKISRRSFLAGTVAAGGAALFPRSRSQGASGAGTLATFIDLSRCDGCQGRDLPQCIVDCRKENGLKYPDPDPNKIKDYWPQPFHEDWTARKDLTSRLTPYNWIFIQRVTVAHRGQDVSVSIPRRCMHCDNPPCVKLCPFGTAKKESAGPVHIDPSLCFGGAKCRTVCPWHVPQRQAGVGVYTYLDPLPVGGGVMYKCDLCRDRLAEGRNPACIESCPRNAMYIGPREEIVRLAEKRAKEIGGEVYGKEEHGGTSTLYVSEVPFDRIDQALQEQSGDPKKVMRLHRPKNVLEKSEPLAKAALIAPLAGIVGAFAATVSRREEKDEK